MHSSNQPKSIPAPHPACGPQLGKAIDQALEQLRKLAIRRDFEADNWPAHAKLWREILNQSKSRGNREVSPNLLKGDLASPIGIVLNGRHWQAYLKWFERNIAPELLQIAVKSGVPAVQAVRIADRKGGFPEKSESIFYLTFFESEEKSQANKIISKAAVEQCQPFDTPTAQATQGELPHAELENNTFVLSALRSKAYRGMNGVATEFSGIADQSHETNNFWQKLLRFFAKLIVVPNQKTSIPTGIVIERRWRFGVSLVLLGIFLLIFCVFLPADSRRWMFVSFSVILLVLGLWDMDKVTNKKAR